MRFRVFRTVLSLACLSIAGTIHAQSAIRWQTENAVLIQRGAAYGRMARLVDGSILCVYSRRKTIHVRHSVDDGKTWLDEISAVEYPWGQVTNAELFVLDNGDVLLMYNERPADGQSPYAIGVCTSEDGGRTWGNHRQVYVAGTEFKNGCWEPSAIELPSGQIQLFFANEGPYRASAEQEIARLRSFDGGRTWIDPQAVSFRAGHRDGMPVPLLLEGGKRIALAIEDNGLAGNFKPAIVSLSTTASADSLPVGGDDPRRRPALAERLPEHVYAGAPYLVQLASGETVLSVQSTEGRGVPHDFTNSRMVVYVGSSTAGGFGDRSVPFEGLTDAPALWNSLFVKDAQTITAISGTTIDGIRGLWAVDGHVEPSCEEE